MHLQECSSALVTAVTQAVHSLAPIALKSWLHLSAHQLDKSRLMGRRDIFCQFVSFLVVAN